MRAKPKVLMLVIAANVLLSAFAWATLTGLIGSLGAFVEFVTMVLNVPGWFLAITIWGWDSPESVLGDVLVIVTNTIVYSIAEILFYSLLKQIVVFLNGRMWPDTE